MAGSSAVPPPAEGAGARVVTPLGAVSQEQGIQADRTQGKGLQAGLRAAFSGWGRGQRPPWPSGFFLAVLEARAAHPLGLALPSAHDLTLCNLLLLLFWVF